MINSRAHFHTLFDNIAQGVILQNADGSVVDVNAAALEILSLSKEEFLGRTSYSAEWRLVSEDGSPLPPTGIL